MPPTATPKQNLYAPTPYLLLHIIDIFEPATNFLLSWMGSPLWLVGKGSIKYHLDEEKIRFTIVKLKNFI